MADLMDELTGNIKKAIDVVDKRQKALVEEIKKEGAAAMDKAAEGAETLLETIDKRIEQIKEGAADPEDSLEHLEKFLDTLKEDIKNLNALVEQRAKEIQLAVKKNSEIVLEEVGENLKRTEEFVRKRVADIQGETDEARKGSMVAELGERLASLTEDLSERIEEARESGAETTRQALEEAQQQIDALTKAVGDLAAKFPVKMKVTPGKEAKAPEKAAAPAAAKKAVKKPVKKT